MTDLSKAEQELVEQLGDFVKLFVHKGEDGDDPPEKWAWTIRGSFPTEVMLWIRSHTDALILAAYETCAKWLKEHGNVMFNGINLADGIRSLAPEAARAALERIKTAARLEEATLWSRDKFTKTHSGYCDTLESHVKECLGCQRIAALSGKETEHE